MTDRQQEQLRLRRAFGSFMTGVTVVTTDGKESGPRGFTANSFSSVSLSPPIVSVCLAKTASGFPVFSRAQHMTINILGEHQRAAAAAFASKLEDKFAGFDWARTPSGCPRLVGCLAWFDCRILDVVEAGDHVILLGEVGQFDTSVASPLGFYAGSYVTPNLVNNVLFPTARAQQLKASAILERDGDVLLEVRQDGTAVLPSGEAGNDYSKAGLVQRLAANGFRASIDFPYSVSEDADAGFGSTIIYRGKVEPTSSASGDFKLVRMGEIPWDLVDDDQRLSLQRFVSEMRDASYGMFFGDRMTGETRRLNADAIPWRRGDGL